MKDKLKVGDKVKISQYAIDKHIFAYTKTGIISSIRGDGRIRVMRDNIVYGEYSHENFWELDDKR